MTGSRLVMLGLPSSGKTTYLAALWGLVVGAAHSSDASLRLTEMPADFEYLQKVNYELLECRPAVRTRKTQRPRRCDLKLKDEHDRVFEIITPDVAGEAFNDLWEKRLWPTYLERLTARADAALLFVRADDITYPHPLDYPRDASETGAGQPVEWDPKLSPTQTQVAHLLQVVRFSREVGRRLPLAVLISAWDTTNEREGSPSAWLSFHLPLLAQLLDSSQDNMPSTIFGVSAQGGDFQNEDDVARIKAISPAEHRAWLRAKDNEHQDITEPVRWLLRRVVDET